MPSAGKFHDKEEDIRKLRESLNFPNKGFKESIEQKKLDPFIEKNLEAHIEKERYEQSGICGPACNYPSRNMAATHLNTCINKELYSSSDVKASKSSAAGNVIREDLFTGIANPSSDDLFRESRLYSVYSSPITNYGVLGCLMILFITIGIVILAVVLLLKFLF